MISLSEDKSCLRRSVYAGLKYAGIDDDCGWIPPSPDNFWVQRIQNKYPQLEFYFNGEVKAGNRPAIIVYQTGEIGDNGKLNTHAVFASDTDPFSYDFLVVGCVILGWEHLKPRKSFKSRLCRYFCN